MKTSQEPFLSKTTFALAVLHFLCCLHQGLIRPDTWPAILTKTAFSLFCVFLSGWLFDLTFTQKSPRAEGKRQLHEGWRREKSHQHVDSSRDCSPQQNSQSFLLLGGDNSRGRKWKLVLLNFTLITVCQERSWGSLAVSVWSTRNRSGVLVSPAMGMCCISSPKNRTKRLGNCCS